MATFVTTDMDVLRVSLNEMSELGSQSLLMFQYKWHTLL